MLHTLMKSPFKIDTFSLIRLLQASDDFLALQDGVLITSIGNIFLEDIVLSSANLYVLQEDLYARGLYKYLSNHFIPISYARFVSLTLKNKQQMAW